MISLRALGVPLGVLSAALALAMLLPASGAAQQGDAGSLTIMLSANDGLRAQGMDYIVQQIDYFHRDGSRASARLFQKEFHWVPGDSRRGAVDGSLAVMFDEENGGTASVGTSAVGNAISRARATWAADACLAATPLGEVVYTGSDVTVFDGLVGGGTVGDPFAADIVAAGFNGDIAALFNPETVAFSVTFIFIDGAGVPTDVDGDGRMDTAHNEIYFNPSFDWTVNRTDAGTDIETTALHELGHALGLGHFGAPPQSVMNPVYGGVQRDLFPIDHAALCVVYSGTK